ncbi:NmrA family transcriptional regulator [Cellulomonas xylanilytica]|uniref:NmrA family transcriptional regulator n=1 Tax=Cellulomonas xylanilytica TaxID=233583 RepID=A0A510V4S3_9CELL|nr:NmrA family transcriptional regulator [Cellulomonas xylanilytica]GEK21873.1 NmrA family transcriptional regulator [Cellulomonas xylanilytica]
MNTPRLLVIGATGKTGRRVTARLGAGGHTVRAVSRGSVPPFDWEVPGTWGPVLEGIDRAYVTFVPDLAAPGAVDTITAFTQAAADAGVQRLVLLSGRGEPGAEACEQVLVTSALEHTIVRASWFAQNFTEGHLVDGVREGVIALPAGDVREPFVDVDDIADVVVAALTQDHHVGRLYEVTGPRLLSFAEAAAVLGVTYVPVTTDEFRAAMTEIAGPDYAAMLTDLCDEVLDGRNESVAQGVQQALRRAPREFADVIGGSRG